MELVQVQAYGATVRLYPGDCALLAELCDLGEDRLISPEDGPKAKAARTYAAAFRALAVAGVALNELASLQGYRDVGGDLEALGRAGFLRPLAGDQKGGQNEG